MQSQRSISGNKEWNFPDWISPTSTYSLCWTYWASVRGKCLLGRQPTVTATHSLMIFFSLLILFQLCISLDFLTSSHGNFLQLSDHILFCFSIPQQTLFSLFGMSTLSPFLITQRKIQLLKLYRVFAFSRKLALLPTPRYTFNPSLLCITSVSYVYLHYYKYCAAL